MLNVFDVVLPPPQPIDFHPQQLYVLDSTLVPCWCWKEAKNLYSRKRRQTITFKYSPTSTSFTFLKPLPGSTHDITSIRIAGLFGYMQPWHHVADEGYVGLGRNTPFKRRPGKPLLEWQKRFN